MRKMILAILIVVSGNVHAEGSFLKPGLWEIKQIHQVMDGRDMTAQMAAAQAKMQEHMSSVPPAQRAQLEAMMSGQGTLRICISEAMAARGKPIVDRDGKCEPASVSRSDDKVTFEFNCTMDGRTRTGKGESTRSGDTITTKMDMTTADAKGTHNMQAETRMTFLGADCQGVKPVDQMGK